MKIINKLVSLFMERARSFNVETMEDFFNEQW